MRTETVPSWVDGMQPDVFRIVRNAWREKVKMRVHCPCGLLLDRWLVEATYYGVDYDALPEGQEPEPTGFHLVDSQVTSGPYKVGRGAGSRATIAQYQPWGQHDMEESGIEGRPRVRYVCGRHGPGCGAEPVVLCSTREQMFLQAYVTGQRDITLP